MNTVTMNTIYAERMKSVVFMSWFITILLVVAGLQLVKKAIAFILMELYGFIIQRNAMRF